MRIEFASHALTAGYLLALAIPIMLVARVRRPAALLPRTVLLLFGSAAIMSLLVISLWWFLDDALTDQLQALDRNGDGTWSESEQDSWSERERAYYRLALDDGARNLFALYVYPVFSLTYSAIVIGGWMLFGIYRRGNG
ncbi:MAG TPA: hypothetical protein VKB27_20665 [Gammaproteobacteria bacterium]|nr:hypothetical protein [Gammaproteobacteria bacterium]